MNILFASGRSVYSGKPVGGAETSMAVMAEELAKRGHKVIYYARHNKTIPGSIKKRHGNVSTYHYSKFPLVWFNHAYEKWLLIKLIHNHDIQLMYCFGKMLHLLSEIKYKCKQKPVLVQRIAGVSPRKEAQISHSEEIQKKTQRLKQVDCFNFQSQTHRNSYLHLVHQSRFNLPEKQHLIQDIGIHPAFFRADQNQQTISNTTVNCVCIMRFSDRKRQDLLVEAFKQLPIHFNLTFIGDGPGKKNIKTMVQHYQLEKRVSFSGFVPRHKIIEALQNHHLYLHPVDYEPQSKALWEAMTLGIPIIHSKVETICSYLTHNIEAIQVNNTPAEWASAIQKASTQTQLLNSMKQLAREKAINHASPEQNADKYESAFRKLITSHAKKI